MTRDEKLLEIYKMGWNDSGDDNPRVDGFTGIERNTYIFGWLDFIVGKYISSVDEQTNEEILERIKNSRYAAEKD